MTMPRAFRTVHHRSTYADNVSRPDAAFAVPAGARVAFSFAARSVRTFAFSRAMASDIPGGMHIRFERLPSGSVMRISQWSRALVEEHEQRTGERIVPQHLADDPREPIERTPQIAPLGRHVDRRSRRNHAAPPRSAATTRPSWVRSAPGETRMTSPRGRTISSIAERSDETVGASSMSVTGRNFGAAAGGAVGKDVSGFPSRLLHA
ncbi:hypothetical protein [Polyangium sp. 6x1]|uniref:hypothetical protein n=1 Tax=Polyangium sp. 6x1 TaxID=3042689 RepID=UPI002482672E|nr:hypothetical protein [Polyangium sp. 6x1]